MERYLQIGKENLKFHLLGPAAAAGGILLFSPLFMGIDNLTAIETAKVLDYFVVLIGIILLPPIFLPEQDKELRDLIRSKYTGQAAIYLIRLSQAVFFLTAYLLVFLFVLKTGNCQAEYVKFFAGCMAGMLFLGGLGLFAYSVSDNVVIGYMVPIIYYIMNYGGGKKIFGDFYLFSLMQGSYTEKWFLFITAVVLLTVGISYRAFKRA